MMGVRFMMLEDLAHPPPPCRAERGITYSKATIAC